MNICEITNGYRKIPPVENAPIETYILNISKHLAMMGHDVTIVDRKYSKTDPDTEYLDEVKIARLRALGCPFLLFVRIRRLARFVNRVQFALDEVSFAIEIRKYLNRKDTQFDVIHIHSAVMGWPLVLWNSKVRKKMAYTSHMNVMMYDPAVLKPDFWEKAHTRLNYAFMRRVRKVIALNVPLVAKIVQDGRVKPEAVVQINSGTDVQLFNPGNDPAGIKERFGLAGKFNVLFVGKIDKVKGIIYLLRAANIVVNEWGYRDARFVLVGSLSEGLTSVDSKSRTGSSSDQYSQQIREMIYDSKLQDNLIMTGLLSAEDLRRMYAACDLFVLPSLSETFPMVVVEAMASGKPVIATSTGGTPLQITEGENGFLVAPGSERDIANKIKYMIDNPSEVVRMGQKSRIRAEAEFTWERVSINLLNVFEQMGS